MSGNIAAAVDCGTHSTRLLIGELLPKNLPKTLYREMRVTRLGEGVRQTNILSEAAIQRTLKCIEDYAQIIQDFAPQKICIVATAAARSAENSQDFLESIEKLLSVKPLLLEGKREAELAFLGATQALDDITTTGDIAHPYLTIDIGGGSTEFGFGTSSCEGSLSIDIGSVNLTEEYIASDPPLPEELYACLSLVETHLSDLAQQMPEVSKAKTLIGMAGTVTTAAAVELGFYDPEAVHHFRLTRAAAEDVFRTLSTEPRSQRITNPGLHPDRVDVIVAGLSILIKTMRFFDFQECLVSESDLLDGVLLEMAAS